MQSPLPETNDPLPPELNRTLAFCRCSSHCGVGSHRYFSFNCLSGGLLNSHIPSKTRTGTAGATIIAKARRSEIIAECRIRMHLMKSLLSFQRTEIRWSLIAEAESACSVRRDLRRFGKVALATIAQT